jgi:hypothetical protein
MTAMADWLSFPNAITPFIKPAQTFRTFAHYFASAAA